MKLIRLPNGLRLVYEKLSYVKSVSFGIWVGTGSQDETPANNGISHYIEHMLFKGTETRTAKQIAASIDNIGGQLNAFTGKECTCYYTKTLDEHLDIAVDVLSDMLFNSRLDKKDLTTEKKVIFEEIGMYEDSPEELVHDMLSESVWAGHSIGYPILGTKKSLRSIDKSKIQDYMNAGYAPGNTVISVAGSFDEAQLIELVTQKFGDWKPGTVEKPLQIASNFTPGITTRNKDIEQVHLCIGFKGVAGGDDALYPLLALNNVLGGGMSSRLFQRIREKNGLVYSIYSYPTAYKMSGLFAVYAGMKPENLEIVKGHITKELLLLKKKGITIDELSQSKEQLKGGYILGLESTGSIMNSMGKSELTQGYVDTPEQVLAKINKITMEDIDEMIKRTFEMDKMGISMVGNFKQDA